jgi:hypothetical protein
MSRLLSRRTKNIANLTVTLEAFDEEGVIPVAAAVDDESGANPEMPNPENAIDNDDNSVDVELDFEPADLVDQLLLLQESAQDVDDSEDGYDDLSEVHANLEQLAASLESTLADGGLNPQGALFFQQSIDQNMRRVGVTKKITASMESFGGASSRLQATTISLESVGEWIAKIWAALKAAAANVWRAVAAFMERIFDHAPKIKAAADKIAKRAAAAKGEARIPEVELGSIDSKISIDGKIPSNALTGIASVSTIVKGMTGGYEDNLNKWATEIAEKMVKAFDTGNGEGGLNNKAAYKVILNSPCPVPPSLTIKEPAKDGAQVHKSPVLPGDVQICATIPLPVEGESEMTNCGKVAFSKVSVGGVAHEGAKMRTLSLGEIQSVMKLVAELAEDSVKARDKFQALHKESDNAYRAIDSFVDVLIPEEDRAGVKTGVSEWNRASIGVARFPSVIYGYAMEVCQAYVELAHKSLASYEGESTGERVERVVKEAPGHAVEKAKDAGHAVKDAAGHVADASVHAAKVTGSAAGAAGNTVADVAKTAAGKVADGASAAAGKVKDAVDKGVKSAKDAAEYAAGKVPDDVKAELKSKMKAEYAKTARGQETAGGDTETAV